MGDVRSKPCAKPSKTSLILSGSPVAESGTTGGKTPGARPNVSDVILDLMAGQPDDQAGWVQGHAVRLTKVLAIQTYDFPDPLVDLIF